MVDARPIPLLIIDDLVATIPRCESIKRCVYDQPLDFAGTGPLPAAAVYDVQCFYEDGSTDHLDATLSLLVEVGFRFSSKPGQTVREQGQLIYADVIREVMKDWKRGRHPESKAPLATRTTPRGYGINPEPGAEDVGRLGIELDVEFQVNRLNPWRQ